MSYQLRAPFSDFVSPELVEGRIPTSHFRTVSSALCPFNPKSAFRNPQSNASVI
ncbi:hypothetical protein D1AOALGA4SA_8804 [Olavius algarvensis Delta 1 endosymbiont]|nr:hypothetical protein D1AOALGA4SA_8804 [Olavius algarvensis Delta 1 endosymbiont]